MQSSDGDFTCTECNKCFERASDLLKHFAVHVTLNCREALDRNASATKKGDAPLPDLYPIMSLKGRKNRCKEENADSGYEDVNPIKFCMVTLEERTNESDRLQNAPAEEANGPRNASKKYQCMYCTKNFGWCTDLKRHILTHTGERPFKCQTCNCSFTRKFLLQKHVKKYHPEKDLAASNLGKIKIPALKPLVHHGKHKQDKCRKPCKAKNLFTLKSNQYKAKCNLIST